MSTRQLRKMRERLEATKIKEPEPEDDFEPLYARNSESAYAGLVLSSSNSEVDDNVDEGDVSDSPPQPVFTRNKNNKKKKKRQAKKSELREVDKCVQEVNEILGVPEAREVVPELPAITKETLLKVDHRYLDREAEFERRFGIDDENRTRKPHERVHVRRQIVLPDAANYRVNVKGFRMVLLEEKNGIKYFKFDHGPEYQQFMHDLLTEMKPRYDGSPVLNALNPMFVPMNTMEGILECITCYFRIEQAQIGLDFLEEAIFLLQRISEPTFTYFGGKTRLEYKHVENRVFHMCLLAYIHVLTNKACHRTALEVAKLMLSLDPSDPLAVVFIMDILALRATEFRWLVNLDENWDDFSRLFNIRYSAALAKRHIAKSTKMPEDKKAADEMMQSAIIQFPNIVPMLLKFAGKRDDVVTNHMIFKALGPCGTPTEIIALQKLYAKMVWLKWRERGIMEWMLENAHIVIRQFDSSGLRQRLIGKEIEDTARLFRVYPIEFRRHVALIRNFDEWLVDSDIPEDKKTPAFNPYPDVGECIDVHKYYANWGVVTAQDRQNALNAFFASLMPDNRGG